MKSQLLRLLPTALFAGALATALAQTPAGPPPSGAPAALPAGVRAENLKLVKDYDKDSDGRLNAAERKAAREYLASRPARGGAKGGNQQPPPPPVPGRRLSPADVQSYPKASLYDMKVLRTVFLEFENPDWEREMVAFRRTDVEVPAKLTVDGKTYPDVGVHFRGASSFNVPEGRKRSLNVDIDFAHKDQRLYGYRTLNLLNSHVDPTFLRSVLYLELSREYIPAPKANYVRVVINGESWGIYINAQQFDTVFIQEHFGTTKGARWRTPGAPNGRANMTYLGDNPADYNRIYEIKSQDDKKSWADLIRLFKVLNETPVQNLEKALQPMLDIDSTLRWLALEKALINSDGYWVRTSDYCIYQDVKGRFHFFPHDANETLREPEGGAQRYVTGGANPFHIDPFAAVDEPNKPLLGKLLAVPSLRARYLSYLREITRKSMDWSKVGAKAQQYQALIAEEVKLDGRKLYSTEAFTRGVYQDPELAATAGTPAPGLDGPVRNIPSLKSFFEQRRSFLLSYQDPKAAALRK